MMKWVTGKSNISLFVFLAAECFVVHHTMMCLIDRYAVIASCCAGCPKLHCERPGCGMDFCYHCKQPWHANQTCATARAKRLSSGHSLSSMSHSLDSNIGSCAASMFNSRKYFSCYRFTLNFLGCWHSMEMVQLTASRTNVAYSPKICASF